VEELKPMGKPHEVIVERTGCRAADLIVQKTYGENRSNKAACIRSFLPFSLPQSLPLQS